MSIDERTRRKVLVVDDQETARFFAAEALLLAGFDVEEAADGLEALSAVAAAPPDLILLDVMMPNMDGFTACATLRELDYAAHVPILMMTGADDEESISRAYDCGATDFIGKPFQRVVLCHRVRYMLRAQTTADELRESEARLAHAQRIAKLGHWHWEQSADEMVWSAEALRVIGFTPSTSSLSTEAVCQRVHESDRDRVELWFAHTRTESRLEALRFKMLDSLGVERQLYQQAEPELGPAGEILRWHGIIQDVTDSAKAQARIHELAFYDSLTGLPNRTLFRQTLNQTLALAKRHDRCLAVLFIDLDDFKRINDTLGHSIGDLLLKGVAGRLTESLRSSDYVARTETAERELVARLGGDEFTVLLSELADPLDAGAVAERILESLSSSFQLSGHEVFISPSIGICTFPGEADDPETLIKNADMAMYCAKRDGKNLFRYYDETMNAASIERLALDTQLRQALEREEFHLEYQPQLELSTNEICGVEALLRWTNERLGRVPPCDFIPIAEENGLIIPIGEWVLRTACEQARRWMDAAICPPRIAVNVSAVQFMQRNFVERVDAILRETGVDPERLELEITESVLSRDIEATIRAMKALKELGIQLAIDDFGTGYSSLSQLKSFPIDRLKIDKSFVQDIVTNENDHIIATAVIGMATTLNLGVVAEGVEDADQQALLATDQCREIQGYHFSRPLKPSALEALLRTHRQALFAQGEPSTGRLRARGVG